MKILTANIEQGMPTVEQSRIRLDQALRTARLQKYTVVKIIHGYGSTGKGGAIKVDVQAQLSKQKQLGKLKLFVKGEDFSPFNEVARSMITLVPELRKDKDYSRNNAGITIALM